MIFNVLYFILFVLEVILFAKYNYKIYNKSFFHYCLRF